ncbi:hypothetical protein [Dictyobacter kobayashii]|uniref:hypothetical protein n=1 Tax=Dictyobacter kobayashii TaxID=2014872 RepID=UPI000F81E2D6|nr:hypothetical protein [Dictyobacter kobayashii]
MTRYSIAGIPGRSAEGGNRPLRAEPMCIAVLAAWLLNKRYEGSPAVLAQFKKEVFTRLAQEARPQGIYETLGFRHILAEKKL